MEQLIPTVIALPYLGWGKNGKVHVHIAHFTFDYNHKLISNLSVTGERYFCLFVCALVFVQGKMHEELFVCLTDATQGSSKPATSSEIFVMRSLL